MPNWCYTNYAVEGDKQEIETLYDTMTELEERSEPLVENGFGKTFLGCLISALGGDWKECYCRGEWNDLDLQGGVLRFSTETAWSPCEDVIEFLKEKFPSLEFYYQAEESGMCFYQTNDKEGKYFPERYLLSGEGLSDFFKDFDTCEYFNTFDELVDWFKEKCGVEVKSLEDIEELFEKWEEEKDDAYCNIYEFEVVD